MTKFHKFSERKSWIVARLPFQYRGIHLLSIIYKLYTSIINKTINVNNLYADEQNCFKKEFSFAGDIFSTIFVLYNNVLRFDRRIYETIKNLYSNCEVTNAILANGERFHHRLSLHETYTYKHRLPKSTMPKL